MYEPGLAARKIATFDDRILDPVRAHLARFDWIPAANPKKYLRGDGSYLLYLPNNPQRMQAFYSLTGPIEESQIDIMCELRGPIEHFMSLTQIEDPYLVQADLAYMPPGGDTVMHIDTRNTHRYSRRFNIAIDTNPDCWLYHVSYDLDHGGIRDHIEPGEIWELNNRIPHTAVNHGTTWRTHLIIDVMPRSYWERMLEKWPKPFFKVPNPQGRNDTYDLDLDGSRLPIPDLFEDRPNCFPVRTHI